MAGGGGFGYSPANGTAPPLLDAVWGSVGVTRASGEVPVVIVGGGPVGLSMSLLLARHGIRSLVVERRPSTGIHPRARIINVRTMEILRVWGLEASVRDAGRALAAARDVIWMTSLSGTVLRRIQAGGDPTRIRDHSPTAFCPCTQDALEPILLARALDSGMTTVQFGHELAAFTQDKSGVIATVVDRDKQEQRTVRARYLVAADGVTSSIRQALGLQMTGHGVFDHRVGIYFTADLGALVRNLSAWVYFIRETDSSPPSGVFGAINNADRWVFMARSEPQCGESEADFNEARSIEIVRRAVGIPDLALAIRSVLPWTIGQEVAERFHVGRIFLAGDAAHVIPPTGGEGMNVGVHDAHNLAWKLAAVLSGWGGASLLDSYQDERLPTARFVGERALLNAANPGRPESFNNEGQALGIAYQSAAVLPDGTSPPVVADPVADYIPTARPGHRAPHVWLERDGARLSTLDLFDTTFTLLAGTGGRRWCTAAEQVGHAIDAPLRAYTIGAGGDLGDPGGTWAHVYGVDRDGAVLVRPDGYVAWRVQEGGENAPSMLGRALQSVLGRG